MTEALATASPLAWAAAAVLTLWALALAVVSGVAVVRAIQARRRARAVGESLTDMTAQAVAPDWVLQRPCAGDEPGLADRLVSALRAPEAARLWHLFTVARADDAAWPVAAAAAATLTAQGVRAEARVVPTAAPNQKAGQQAGLVAALAAEGMRPTLLVNVDSDVDLAGFDLGRLVAPLLDRSPGEPQRSPPHPPAGATWCPPVEVGPATTLGDRASHAFLNGSLHAFALLGGLDPHGLVGKVCAVRLDRFDAAGGFTGLADTLGEDMEVARRLRTAGFGAPMVAQPVRSAARGRSLGAAVARYARWLAVIRAQRPALMVSYPLLFAATLPLVTLALCCGPLAWPALALALAARLAVAVAARRLGDLPTNPLTTLADVVLGELVTWAAWLRAMATRRVVWRGHTLVIPRGPGGALRVARSAPSPPAPADLPPAAAPPPGPGDARGGD